MVSSGWSPRFLGIGGVYLLGCWGSRSGAEARLRRAEGVALGRTGGSFSAARGPAPPSPTPSSPHPLRCAQPEEGASWLLGEFEF